MGLRVRPFGSSSERQSRLLHFDCGLILLAWVSLSCFLQDKDFLTDFYCSLVGFRVSNLRAGTFSPKFPTYNFESFRFRDLAQQLGCGDRHHEEGQLITKHVRQVGFRFEFWAQRSKMSTHSAEVMCDDLVIKLFKSA